MEADDDGFFVIIIGDEGELQKVSSGSESAPVTKKRKRQHGPESSLLVEEIIDTAKKPSKPVDRGHLSLITKTKQEPFCHEYRGEEYLNDSEDDQIHQKDNTYNQEDLNKKYLRVKEFATCEGKQKKKITIRKSGVSRGKSYLKQLGAEHPGMKRNSEAFVQLVADIMKSIKPPPPPPDFYRICDMNYECIECSHVLNSVPAATRHYQDYHGPLYLQCFACGAEFRSQNNLYKHEKRCRAPDALIVLRARALAMVKRGRHRPFMLPKIPRSERNRRYLSKQEYKCTECSAEFKAETSLTAHLYMHRGERPYVCNICDAAYTTNSALSRHMELHSGNKYVCDYCQKEFQRKTSIQYHIETHMPRKRFHCPFTGCGRHFTAKPTLNAHINRIHKNLPPPCPCEICLKRFPKISALKVHMREKHGVTIMTRNMLFRSMPTLSDTQVQQAKVVFNDNFDNSESTNLEEEKQILN